MNRLKNVLVFLALMLAIAGYLVLNVALEKAMWNTMKTLSEDAE